MRAAPVRCSKTVADDGFEGDGNAEIVEAGGEIEGVGVLPEGGEHFGADGDDFSDHGGLDARWARRSAKNAAAKMHFLHPKRHGDMATSLRLVGGFGLENLHLEQHEIPTPGAGEVLVRFKAASLNYRDLLITKGQYNPRMMMPRVLGSDAAGEVLAVGDGVTKWKTGDRVTSLFFQKWMEGMIRQMRCGTRWAMRLTEYLQRIG